MKGKLADRKPESSKTYVEVQFLNMICNDDVLTSRSCSLESKANQKASEINQPAMIPGLERIEGRAIELGPMPLAYGCVGRCRCKE